MKKTLIIAFICMFTLTGCHGKSTVYKVTPDSDKYEPLDFTTKKQAQMYVDILDGMGIDSTVERTKVDGLESGTL